MATTSPVPPPAGHGGGRHREQRAAGGFSAGQADRGANEGGGGGGKGGAAGKTPPWARQSPPRSDQHGPKQHADWANNGANGRRDGAHLNRVLGGEQDARDSISRAYRPGGPAHWFCGGKQGCGYKYNSWSCDKCTGCGTHWSNIFQYRAAPKRGKGKGGHAAGDVADGRLDITSFRQPSAAAASGPSSQVPKPGADLADRVQSLKSCHSSLLAAFGPEDILVKEASARLQTAEKEREDKDKAATAAPRSPPIEALSKAHASLCEQLGEQDEATLQAAARLAAAKAQAQDRAAQEQQAKQRSPQDRMLTVARKLRSAEQARDKALLKCDMAERASQIADEIYCTKKEILERREDLLSQLRLEQTSIAAELARARGAQVKFEPLSQDGYASQPIPSPTSPASDVALRDLGVDIDALPPQEAERVRMLMDQLRLIADRASGKPECHLIQSSDADEEEDDEDASGSDGHEGGPEDAHGFVPRAKKQRVASGGASGAAASAAEGAGAAGGRGEPPQGPTPTGEVPPAGSKVPGMEVDADGDDSGPTQSYLAAATRLERGLASQLRPDSEIGPGGVPIKREPPHSPAAVAAAEAPAADPAVGTTGAGRGRPGTRSPRREGPAGAEGERRRDRARSTHAARTAEEEVEHARRAAAAAALAGTGARAAGGHPPRY